MKKYFIPSLILVVLIAGIVAMALLFSDRDPLISELTKLNIYSKEEISFLEKEGFLDGIDSDNLPDNKEQVMFLLKSPDLIEQNINSPDESFEVLATKLNKDNYQLAFKLENKSNEPKEFFLIPVAKDIEFESIKGVINSKNLLSINKEDVKKEPLHELYDIQEHKRQLNPQLAYAYDDIDNNNYQAKPIKITLDANSTLLAKSQWQITRGPTSGQLEPVYLLVYGSAGGAKDDLVILNLHSSPQKEDNWEVKFTTVGMDDLKIIPNDQATIDDDEFTGLYCNEEQRYPEILSGDVIYYSDWQCNSIGKVVHYTKKADKHTLRFEFSGQTAYAYNSPDVIDNLGGYWKFDEASGNALDSHGSDHGIVNGATPGAAGILSNAYTFDGANDIITFSNWGYSGTATLSLQAWIYPTTGVASLDAILWGSDQIVLRMNGTTNIEWFLVAFTGDDKIISTGNLITLDAWNHIVATFDGTKMHLYINGTEFGAGVTPTGAYSAGLMTCGARTTSTNTFTGRLDEIAHWSRALTQAEVTSLYNGGAGLAYPFVTNNAPTISSVTDSPDPVKQGNDTTFSVDWNDADVEGIKMLACKTNAITAVTPACDGGEWCSNKNDYDSTDPIICTYTTTSSELGSNDYYIFVCDNEPTCSSSTSGTFTVEPLINPSIKFPGGLYFKGGTIFK